MRVAVYLRQSSDRDQNELGIDRQRSDVMSMVSARNWSVVETFIDNDVSATNRKPRPQFEQMMAGVSERRFDVIAVRHLDRLVRRMADLERVLDLCEKSGVHIVSASDGVDTSTDGGRLVARILASVGQGEVERKSARQRSAAIQAAEQGRRVGGRRPFGYEPDGITIRESEAKLIRQAVDDVLAGETATAVARAWNAAGSVTTQGNQWTRSAVTDVLGNPRIAGLRRHRPAGSASMLRSRPLEGIVGMAEWPPIVPEETFKALARTLFPADRRGRTTRSKGLLTGYAVCGVCGLTVHQGGATHGNTTYRCKSNRHVSRRSEPIDQWVQTVAVTRLKQADAASLFLPSDDAAGRDLSAEADVLRRRLADLAVDYADGVLDRDQMRQASDRLRVRLQEVESDLAASFRADGVADVLLAGDIEEAWNKLSVARRRSIMAVLFTPVIELVGAGVRKFDPASVTFEWNEGVERHPGMV